MSLSHNQVQLAGRVGYAPELHRLTDGTPAVRFHLYQRQRQADEETSVGFTLSATGAMAEHLARVLRRNDHLFVQGKLRLRAARHQEARFYRPVIELSSFHLLQRPAARPDPAGQVLHLGA